MTYLRTSKPGSSALTGSRRVRGRSESHLKSCDFHFSPLTSDFFVACLSSFVDLHRRRRQIFSPQVFSQIASGLAQEISSCATNFFFFPEMRGSVRISASQGADLRLPAGIRVPQGISAPPSREITFALVVLQLYIRYLTGRISSRFEFVLREKIFRELFHTTKYFVLVCRLFTF